jgi:hypothetical protein
MDLEGGQSPILRADAGGFPHLGDAGDDIGVAHSDGDEAHLREVLDRMPPLIGNPPDRAASGS